MKTKKQSMNQIALKQGLLRFIEKISGFEWIKIDE